MTVARAETVQPGVEGIYHCVSRCVRRAYLCGEDRYSGQSFEHRKEWVRDRLEFLAGVFAVEVCAYAVMSNHLHLVLRLRPDQEEAWTDEVVATRWLTLFPGRWGGEDQSPPRYAVAALAADKDRLAVLRERLSNLSWFMRCLNEFIARRANREDNCAGRFWEGRFRAQAILDESALLACMAYVDLNPIRAGIAQTPESSDFTSGQERAQGTVARHTCARRTQFPPEVDRWLSPIEDTGHRRGLLPMTNEEYLQVLDETGRILREDKHGAIPEELAPILERLQVEPAGWSNTVGHFGRHFSRAAGREASLEAAAERAGRRWFKGKRKGRRLFPPRD